MLKSKGKITLTTARQNFFQLIKLADLGESPIIENAENGSRYRLIKEDNKPQKDVVVIAKRMGKIKSDIGPIDELTSILRSTHDTKI